MRDFGKNALDLIEDGEGGDLIVAGESLAQQAAISDEVFGKSAFARDVAGIADFGHDDPGAIQVVGEGNAENAFARLIGKAGRVDGRLRGRVAARAQQECADDQHSGSSRLQNIHEPERRPGPDPALEVQVGLGNRPVIAEVERLGEWDRAAARQSGHAAR